MPPAFGDSATSEAPPAPRPREASPAAEGQAWLNPSPQVKGQGQSREGLPGPLESVATLGGPKKSPDTPPSPLRTALARSCQRRPAETEAHGAGAAGQPGASSRARPPSSAHSPCQGRKAWQEPVGGLCQGPLGCELSCPGLSSTPGSQRGSARPTALTVVSSSAHRRRRGKGGDPAPQPAGSPARGAGDRRRRPQGDGWDNSQHPPVSVSSQPQPCPTPQALDLLARGCWTAGVLSG